MAHEHIVYMMMTDAAARVRDEAAVRRYAPRLEELAQRDEHRPYLAIADRAWGVAHRLAGEYEDAEIRLKKAIEAFTELDSKWQLGRTLSEMAELERARSNVEAARDYGSQALAAFEAMGAGPDAERVREGEGEWGSGAR